MRATFLWNAENGWVSFLFQGGRGAPGGELHPGKMLSILAGEIGLLLPWIFIPLALAVFQALRRSRPNSPERFLLWLALPPILLFTIIPLWGNHNLPHWTMPGWFFAFPLLGQRLAAGHVGSSGLRRWAAGSAGALLVLLLITGSHAATGWIRLAAPDLFKAGDPTLEAFDWTRLASADALQSGRPGGPAFVVTTRWFDGGKVDQALGGRLPVLVLSSDPRQFAFTYDERDFLGKDAVIVARAADADATATRLAPYFDRILARQAISLGRSGMDEIDLVLIRASHFRLVYPLPYPRSPATAQGPL